MKTQSFKASILGLFFCASAIGFAQTDIEIKPVHFEKGKSSSTVKGTITGNQVIDYTLSAKEGQEMTVKLSSSNTSNYFNVLPSDSETAIFIGSMDGNSWTGELPKDDTYRVRVYLMRNAARRNDKVNFTINMGISGEAHDVGDVKYDATGMVPSSTGPDPKGSAQSDFGVVRTGMNKADVYLSTPWGNDYILHFDEDEVFLDDDKDLKVEKIEDNYMISINDSDFFTIPEAVITGG